MKLLHNGKPASNEISHFSHSVSKTQCAEMQLIEYSAQNNALAAPLKCRQLHIQREHIHAEFRDLLEQMKDKTPSHYYTDVLVENRGTLKDFLGKR